MKSVLLATSAARVFTSRTASTCAVMFSKATPTLWSGMWKTEVRKAPATRWSL